MALISSSRFGRRRPAGPSGIETRGCTTHDGLVKTLAGDLERRGWKVATDSLVGTVRPDLIATDPGGELYVFEVKGTAAHLGAVAQVEAYRDSLFQERGAPAHGVLVVEAGAPTQLDAVAQAADVQLLRVDSGAAGMSLSLDRLASSV